MYVCKQAGMYVWYLHDKNSASWVRLVNGCRGKVHRQSNCVRGEGNAHRDPIGFSDGEPSMVGSDRAGHFGCQRRVCPFRSDAPIHISLLAHARRVQLGTDSRPSRPIDNGRIWLDPKFFGPSERKARIRIRNRQIRVSYTEKSGVIVLGCQIRVVWAMPSPFTT